MHARLAPEEKQQIEQPPTRNPEAYTYYLRGIHYRGRGELRIAVEIYEQAVELDPGFALAHANLSMAHSAMYWFYHDRSEARMEQARHEAERALELEPDLSAGHRAMGMYFYRLNEWDRAIEELELAAEGLRGSGGLSSTLGLAHRRMGNWEAALAEFRKYAEYYPQSSTPPCYVGSALYYMRRYTESEPYLDRAISLEPDWDQPSLVKAWLQLSARGDAPAARRVLDAARERAGSERLVSFMDDLQPWYMLRSAGRDDYEWLGSLSRDFFGIDTASYYLMRAELFQRSGRPDGATALYDSVRALMDQRIETRPQEPLYHSQLGVALAGLGRHDEALTAAQKAIHLLPVRKDALWGRALHENLAWVHVAAGE
jgi:tetratricopeptide (TPR) repeat protein